jgi:hypothetical protein
MRKPYNNPIFSVVFSKPLSFQSLDGLSGWDVMRTRCQIQGFRLETIYA